MLVNLLNQIKCANTEETLDVTKNYYVCDSPFTELIMTTDTVTRTRELAANITVFDTGLTTLVGNTLESSTKRYTLKKGSIIATDNDNNGLKFLELKKDLTVQVEEGTFYVPPTDEGEHVFVTTVENKENGVEVQKNNDSTTKVTLPKMIISFCYSYDKTNPLFKLTNDKITCDSVQGKNEFMFLTKTDAKTKDAAFSALYQFVDECKLTLIQTNDDLLLLGKEKLLENVNKSKFAKHVMKLGTSSGMKIMVKTNVQNVKVIVVEDVKSKLYDAVCEKLKSVNVPMEAFLEDTKEMTKKEVEEFLFLFQLYEDISGIQELYNAFDTKAELELLNIKLNILFGFVADCNKALLPTVDCLELDYGDNAIRQIPVINVKYTALTVGQETDGKTTYANPFNDDYKKTFVEHGLLLHRTLKARENKNVGAVSTETTDFYNLCDKLMARFVEECKPIDTAESTEILAKVKEISEKYDQLLAEKYLLKDSWTTLGNELQTEIAANKKLAELNGQIIKAIHETHSKKYSVLKKLKDLLALPTLITDFETEITAKHAEIDAAKTDKVKLEEFQKIFESMLAFFNENKEAFGEEAKKTEIESVLNGHIDEIKAHIAGIDGTAAITALVTEAKSKTDEIAAALKDTAKPKEELENLEQSADAVFGKFATYTEADFSKYPDLKTTKGNLTAEIKNLKKVTDPSGKKGIDKLKVDAKAKTAEIKSALADKAKTVDDLEKVQKDSKVTLHVFEQFMEEIKTDKDLQTAKDELTKEMDDLDKQIVAMKKTPEPEAPVTPVDPKKPDTTTPKEEESKESEGLSTGAIIGIVIGVIAAIIIVGVVGWLIYKQNMSGKKEIEEEELLE